MSAAEWGLLASVFVGAIAGAGVAIALVGINRTTEGDDAEQRRAVSRPAELDDELRDRGLL